MRVSHTLTLVERSVIYKEVLCWFIRPECSLCWSTTMFSLGHVVFFLPKMWLVFTWMEIMSSETREGYGLRIAHSSMIYPSPLCKVLIVKSSWYRNYHMISHGMGENFLLKCVGGVFCNKVWCHPERDISHCLSIVHSSKMYREVLYTM